MTLTRLDLSGLKCPLPALMTRKALKTLSRGDRLEVVSTDPLAAIDIPALIHQMRDEVQITEQRADRITFLIEKRSGASA